MTAYWLERAVVDGEVRESVRVEIQAREFTAVEVGVEPGGADRLAGLTIPGLANCHSHAFHRALRGRTQRGRGTFWTWREQMYDLAGRLTPDSYYELARATYREMLATGFTSVGEFHYLHHGPDGTPYDDPNAMGRALVQAAADAGLRITLLDTCYLAGGLAQDGPLPLAGLQLRFGDGDAVRWAARVTELECDAHGMIAPHAQAGAAIHSVRAVPRDQMHLVAEWAERRTAPLHAHVSEQLAENVACQEAYGETPTGVLEEAGALGPRSTAVHATHLTDDDVAMLGSTGTHACFCPTTERDLADGIGPSRLLHDAGSALTLGTDSHAVLDAFEEMRAVELDERLQTQERGRWSAAELLAAASVTGHRSLGFEAGRIAVGAPADLVTLDVRSPRTAGTGAGLETVVFAASAADVVHVVAQGRVVVEPGAQAEIGTALDHTIRRIWED
ncbi:MAG: formimidoylglutamate deiminase [Nocardioides sp.]